MKKVWYYETEECEFDNRKKILSNETLKNSRLFTTIEKEDKIIIKCSGLHFKFLIECSNEKGKNILKLRMFRDIFYFIMSLFSTIFFATLSSLYFIDTLKTENLNISLFLSLLFFTIFPLSTFFIVEHRLFTLVNRAINNCIYTKKLG